MSDNARTDSGSEIRTATADASTTHERAPSHASRLLTTAPALVVLAICVANMAQFADPDLWGHVAFGLAMIHQKAVLTRDTYSYTAAGLPFLNHEWLSQIIIAATYQAAGVIGLKLLKFACTSATIVLLAAALAATGAAIEIQASMLLTASLALIPEMLFRPQLFGFVLLAGMMLVFARDTYIRPSAPFIAIPLMALWVNLHGSFAAGFAALTAYVATRSIEHLRSDGHDHRLVSYILILTGAFAATFATPYGTGAWQAVIHTIVSRAKLNANQEWTPLFTFVQTNWGVPHSGIFFPLLGISLLALLIVIIPWTMMEHDLPVDIVGLMLGLTPFFSVRNLALAVIGISVPLTRHLGLLHAHFAKANRQSESEIADQMRPVWSAALTALAFAMSLWSGEFSFRMPDADAYPNGAISFIEEHNLHGKVLNEYNWGEYLIFHTAPKLKVFIDGRYQIVYPAKVIDDYLNFIAGNQHALSVVHQYDPDFILVGPRSQPYELLSAQPEWKLIYRDSIGVLFARRDLKAATISPVIIPAKSSATYFPQ